VDLIDAHVHIESIPWASLQEMSMSGIRAVISVPVWPWRTGVITTAAQTALVNRLLNNETWRAGENNIQLFIGIGVVGISIPEDVEKFFPVMEDFLSNQKVLAIGEVGLDPRSKTCKDLNRQEEILRVQLKMAKDKDLPAIIHTPPDLGQVTHETKEKYEKGEFMEKSVELVREVGLSPDRVVLDHLDTEEWVKFALDNGCYAGITIQDWRGIAPEQVALWADTLGPERVLLNTDTSPMPSDHLGVPKTVFHLRKRKVSEEKIQTIIYQNPKDFYRIPL
jgi:predicted metal-dependent TIM-barrel fold hydrolase